MADLLVIVPSRGRPESVPRVVRAWLDTGAYDDGARLVFAIDSDDPRYAEYHQQPMPEDVEAWRPLVSFGVMDQWQPMVRKLNQAATFSANWPDAPFALAFMGDDHIPRTSGWAGRYLAELRELGTGIVYGDDGIQGERLPTQWAMTADIVRALGRMVPADVEHLYCDNAIRDLGQAAGCLRYLPDVVIEHMHPVARKAPMDDGYRRVNQPAQYERDHAAYQRWRSTQLAMDAGIVRTLREKRHEHAH